MAVTVSNPNPLCRFFPLSPSGAADGDTCLQGRWVPFLEAPVDDFLKKKTKKTLSELSVTARSLCKAAAP